MLYCIIVLYNITATQSVAASSLTRAHARLMASGVQAGTSTSTCRIMQTSMQTDSDQAGRRDVSHELPELSTSSGEAVPEGDIRFVYVDNSDDETIVAQNRRICVEKGSDLVSMHGNQGLPAAYMAGISFAREHGADYVLLSDEDSTYDMDYLQNLYAQMREHPEALFYLPHVVTAENGTVMSPFDRGGVRFYINSGMAADARVFDQVSYDTGLFLDYADNDFWQSCYAAGLRNRIQYVPAMRIVQDFSGSRKRGIDADERRFARFVRDGCYYYRKWHGRNAGPDMWIRCLHLCVMYRSLRFLRIMVSRDE